MTNLNLTCNNTQPIGIDGDIDTGKPRRSRRNVEPIDWGSANMTTLGPENKQQAKSILTDATWIAMEEMSPVEEDTIEQKCFHWEIDNWSNLPHEARGPVFEAGGHEWNLLLFPRGNHGDFSHISVYLELTNAKDTCRPDQHACAQYVILVSSISDPTNYYCKPSRARFSNYCKDWGFNDFLPHERLLSFKDDKERVSVPFLENDRIRFSVIVNVVRDPTGVLWMTDFENYDSREHTGFVGLRNQGATCYMNSLFQSLYCTNAFRKAVYQIPTENDNPTDSIALSMQRLFHNLQFSNNAVDTVEVTKSFKWNSLDTLMQHDVQEFNRLLQDKLEEKMMVHTSRIKELHVLTHADNPIT
ncbi:cysteine proteinase [Lichtheimia corymbifera JMRC:FSU:9682]|uniref:Cysteine proteinase n=1 Tax=Lichtheimia corymbifera JMRC:FSU:9682 TaxID=1263082 RepID=A0A068RPJ1_9FUNG|nr:cysteine proteinase [Lichtheimia corymbifera JMRC:FSU:9682]